MPRKQNFLRPGWIKKAQRHISALHIGISWNIFDHELKKNAIFATN